MRSLGFSLEDIRRIVSGEVRTESELERREAELQREIRANRSRLEQVQAYLARIHEGDAMTGKVTVKALPEVIVASMRTTVPGYRAVGHPRESYIDGVWNRDDPREWRTEVQVPIAAGGGDE